MSPAVLITGAAGGIGQALCQRFKGEGYFVLGLDLNHVSETICDVAIQTDLARFCRDTPYRDRLSQHLNHHVEQHPLSTLINNAAVQILNPLEQLTVDDWHHTLDVNLLAPVLLSQTFLPQLEANQGSIINISSIHASLTKPNFTCYATSKTALVGLTQSLAVELGNRVRVNAICPAAVATPMLLEGFQESPDSLKQLSQMHPLGRIAEPDEIAQVAFFLASPMASFITGTALGIDGGIAHRLHDPI